MRHLFAFWFVSLVLHVVAAGTDRENFADRLAALFDDAGFAGEVMISEGNAVVYADAFGAITPGGDVPHELGNVWRWASVSKQVTATLVMLEIAAGNLELDATVRRYLPNSRTPNADVVTIRQLMQHLSGLRHTDDEPEDQNDWPRFYQAQPGGPDTGLSFCEGPTKTPPGTFRYNNCDYIMLEAVLEAATGSSYKDLLRTHLIEPLELATVGVFPADVATVPGYVGGKPEAAGLRMANYGASGAIYGSAEDLVTFNRALLNDLLPDQLREVMWQGDVAHGYAALGQWSFPARLAGCAHEVQVVERRGAIGGVQGRNLLLPERGLSVVMMTNRSEADFSFGEIWTQQGLSHDVLSALFCL